MKPVRLPIKNIDRENGLVWVKSKAHTFPCQITNKVARECMRLGDDAVVVKSAVTGEWLCIDYKVDTPVNYAIHNSAQEELPESQRDYIYNEKGELYE